MDVGELGFQFRLGGQDEFVVGAAGCWGCALVGGWKGSGCETGAAYGAGAGEFMFEMGVGEDRLQGILMD